MTTIQMITTFLVIGATGVVIFIIVDAIPSRHSQRIKFNDFINLYVINPDRWELSHRFVLFVKSVKGYYITSLDKIMFQFSIIDYYRYRHWKHTLEKQKQKEKECKQLQEVITILKSDLKKFEQQNTERMNKASQDTINFVRGTVLCKSKVQDIQSILNIHRK
jgi:hypothetical protein